MSAAAASQRPDGRGSPQRSPARRGAAGITARSLAAARAAATTDGITSAADSEGSPSQGSPPPGPIDVVSDSLALIYIISSLLGSYTDNLYLEEANKMCMSGADTSRGRG